MRLHDTRMVCDPATEAIIASEDLENLRANLDARLAKIREQAGRSAIAERTNRDQKVFGPHIVVIKRFDFAKGLRNELRQRDVGNVANCWAPCDDDINIQ